MRDRWTDSRWLMLALVPVAVFALGSPRASAEVVQAVGVGRAPQSMSGAQARLMAERGAQLAAARNLIAATTHAPEPAPPAAYGRFVRGRVSGHAYHPTRFQPDGLAVSTVVLPREGAVTGETRVLRYRSCRGARPR